MISRSDQLLVILMALIVGVKARFLEWQRLGVLSQGNFDTVHHLVPNAAAVVATDQEHLYSLVESGMVDAGLISGVPDTDRFNVIPSGSISPRAMLTRPGDDDTRRVIDAAIVRLQGAGKLFDFSEANQPFNFVEVHTCRSASPDIHLPLPDTDNSTLKVIRIGALGPYNWGQDGDYTATPPTGFWPDFLRGMQDELTGYNLTRVYYPGSADVMNALAAGDVDATEPYWTVDSFYNNNPRTWRFDAGCTTLGYESNFLTAKTMATSGSSASGSGASWIIPVAASLVALAALIVAVMIYRERRGNPVFRPLLMNQDSYEVSVVDHDSSSRGHSLV